jgi:ribulose-5-phosphate 4-epimerase/fuculose-1-phosphate aldolase
MTDAITGAQTGAQTGGQTGAKTGAITGETQLRDQICLLAKSMFDRGLTGGSTGNISARTSDGGLLVSPTGACFGRLDPARLSRFDAGGNHISGDQPTKEMPLHSAFYDTRSTAGAVVHLHSCHSVALSMMPDVDPDNFLPPLTPYGIMKLGKVALLPFFLPGDPAMGEAVRGLAGKRTAVMLANHGPVVAGKDIEAACNAIEELEDTSRLAMMTRGLNPRMLSQAEQKALITKFDVEWDV